MAEYKSAYTGQEIDAGIGKAYQAVEAVQNSGDGGTDGTIKITKGSSGGGSTVLYVKPKNINNGAYRDVDTEITSGSTSQNLPTSQAVANFVSSHSGSNISVKEIDYSNPQEWNSEEEQPTAQVIDDILDNKYTLIHIYNIVIDEGVSVEMYLVSSGMIDVEESGVARYYYKFDEGDEDEGTSPNIEQYLFVHQEGESAQMIVENFELGGSSGTTSWGSITGTLSSQTDLQNALNSKGTYSKPSGGIPDTDLSGAVQTSLGKADSALQSSALDNYYTKTQIDTKISAVYKYKGTVSNYTDLPVTGMEIGDVYNIENASSSPKIKAGDNVAWNGTTWDVLAGDIDLSGYQTKIDSSHKLSADLVDDSSSTNKFVTASDKTTWNGKSVVSGTNDGTNWTALTIDGTTKSIPAGGGDIEYATNADIDALFTPQVQKWTVDTSGIWGGYLVDSGTGQPAVVPSDVDNNAPFGPYYLESNYSDYTVDHAFVYMGGVDITATAYDASNDGIYIEHVTGNITFDIQLDEVPEEPEEEDIPIQSLRYTDGSGNTCVGFSMLEGESVDLWTNLEITPSDATDGIEFISDDDGIVQVDSGGIATATGVVGESTTITMSSMENPNVYTTVEISISENEPEEEEE